METNKRGRPTKANQERMEAICAMLEIGATRKDAANANGIHYSTFIDWMNLFPDFPAAVETSEGVIAAKMTARLYSEAIKEGGDWKASLEWLKRRRRDDWGDKQLLEHSGAIGRGPDLTKLSQSQLDHLELLLDAATDDEKCGAFSRDTILSAPDK